MAYSGNIGGTTFNALKVVDHAFRRCRLPAQAITAEMQSYALDSLFMMLSELANIKTPSWCIERVVLPMYENQPIIPLPIGTIDVLNFNYRTIMFPEPDLVTETTTSYKAFYQYSAKISTVGVKWAAPSVPLIFEVSNDDVVWTQVGSLDVPAVADEIVWVDIDAAKNYDFFRVRSTQPIYHRWIQLGGMPTEIPLGQLNRDSYVNQSNKIFPGRPSNYYYQRDLPDPVAYIWPAPFTAAESAQLILWRHRQIMDTTNLQQSVEVPHRWYEAIVNGLAFRVASETPAVDVQLLPALSQIAAQSVQRAWDGDNDGSPIQINPGIGAYTK